MLRPRKHHGDTERLDYRLSYSYLQKDAGKFLDDSEVDGFLVIRRD
jgi:hypothetical protein